MNKNLVLLAASMFIWGIGEGMFVFLQPLYLQELGANPILIGTILSGLGAVMAIAHIPAGYLADKIGRRPLIWLSWGLGILAALVMALSSTLPGFVSGLLIYGLTYFVMSPLYSYATAARGRLSASQAIMLISSAFNLGMVIGPWLGGILGEQYGLRTIFYYAAGIFLLASVVVVFIAPQPVTPRHTSHTRVSILKDSRLLVYLGVVFFTMLAIYLPQPLSQNYLHNELSLNIETIGRLAALAGLGVAAINLLVGRLDPRLGMLIGQTAVGAFAFLLWKGQGVAWLALGYFLLGGYKTTRSLMVAQTSHLVHPSNLGFTFGVTETVGSVATILAAMMAGVLYHYAPPSIYGVSLILVVVSLWVSWRFWPDPHPTSLLGIETITPIPKEDGC